MTTERILNNGLHNDAARSALDLLDAIINELEHIDRRLDGIDAFRLRHENIS